MIRNIILSIVLLAGTGRLYAQEKLDSLTSLLQAAQSDSVRFLLTIQLSQEAEFYDYKKSREYAAAATALSENLGEWAKGKLYFRLAFMETLEGDYAAALKYDLQSAAMYIKQEDSSNLATAYIDIGNGYREMGEYDEAYFYLMQSYWIAKNHDQGPTSKDSLSMCVALHNIGTVFIELGQFDIAQQHLIASDKISEAIVDPEGAAYSHDEFGEFYRKQRDFVRAEENLLLAARESRSLKIRFLIPRVQAHLANVYLDKGDYNKSLIYFDSARSEYTSINSQFGLAQCELGTGKVLAKLGNYPEALRRFEKSLDVSIQLNAKNLTLSCYSAMASAYELMKSYERSLAYLRKHDGLRDSIFSKATMEKLFQDQLRFETMNKDLEIEALSQLHLQQTSTLKRQELVQNVLVIVAVLSIILLYTVYRSSRRRKRINLLLLEHQEEIKRRSAELHQLNQVKDKFFSIISHDLRSPMSALAGTLNLLDQKRISPAEFEDVTKALRVQFNHTQTLINNLLDWTILQMDKLTLQPEQVNLFAFVEESFAVLRGLYPKNIILENRIDSSLDVFADPNMLNLVLRNLILNAIKFTEPGGNVWVEAVETESETIVSVCDKGRGIDPDKREFLFTKTSRFSTRGTANEKGTGLGLILCKEFIEKNGGKIWMQSEVGVGSSFHFTLPASKKHDISPAHHEALRG